MQNFNQLWFLLALTTMILLTLSTVSISAAADNQTATLPHPTLGDKLTCSADFQFPSALVGTLSTEFINFCQRFL